MAAIQYIKWIHKDRVHVWKGTISELVEKFVYTLECGHSWCNKIPENPKTLKSLVKALTDSAYVCNEYHDSYYESNEEEYNKFELKKEGV